MIQVNDTNEYKGKASKGSLADFAELEATRLAKTQIWLMLAIIPIVVAEFFLGKAGWFILPAVSLIAGAYAHIDSKITQLRGRSASYKPLKAKTIYPRRDSVR